MSSSVPLSSPRRLLIAERSDSSLGRLLDAWQHARAAGHEPERLVDELRRLEACGRFPDGRRHRIDGSHAHWQLAAEAPPAQTVLVVTPDCPLPAALSGAAVLGVTPPEPDGGIDRFPDAPAWDANRRVLLCGGVVVKRFRQPAVNQELILEAFQEDGWPERIDDPLPNQPGTDPRQRLKDTLRALNRHQEYPVLRFTGDGTGTGILWEWIGPAGRPRD